MLVLNGIKVNVTLTDVPFNADYLLNIYHKVRIKDIYFFDIFKNNDKFIVDNTMNLSYNNSNYLEFTDQDSFTKELDLLGSGYILVRTLSSYMHSENSALMYHIEDLDAFSIINKTLRQLTIDNILETL